MKYTTPGLVISHLRNNVSFLVSCITRGRASSNTSLNKDVRGSGDIQIEIFQKKEMLIVRNTKKWYRKKNRIPVSCHAVYPRSPSSRILISTSSFLASQLLERGRSRAGVHPSVLVSILELVHLLVSFPDTCRWILWMEIRINY